MTRKTPTIAAAAASLVAAAALLPLTVPAQDHTDTDSVKTVRSAGGRVSERGNAATRERSTFVETETTATERLRNRGKGDSATAAVVLEEAWIYDADVELFDDYDGDGYYTFMRVSFDADSIYAEHWVYARLFVTLDGTTWDEYHITDDFLVEGTSAFDSYEVETELLSGFQPGLYDVLIELYDADLGHYLGEFGPVQSSAFSLLPLEDVEFDSVEPVVIVTTEHGGGGATGVPALGGLALLALFAYRRRKTCSAVV